MSNKNFIKEFVFSISEKKCFFYLVASLIKTFLLMPLKNTIQNYGWVLPIFLFASCSKRPDPEPVPLQQKDSTVVVSQPKKDSVVILQYAQKSNGGLTRFQYDTVNHHYTGWSETYNSYNFDSTFIFYNSDGTIRSIADKEPETPAFRARARILNYNNNKQIVRIDYNMFRDAAANGSFDQSYYTASSTELVNYDSVVYGANKQVVAVYNYTVWSPPKQPTLSLYRRFEYLPGDTLLSAIKDTRYDNSTNTVDSSYSLIFTYTQMPNPYYKIFGKQAIILFSWSSANFYLIPGFYNSKIGSFLAAGSPYLCNSMSQSYDFLTEAKPRYTWSSDSLFVTIVNGQNLAEWVKLSCKKIRG